MRKEVSEEEGEMQESYHPHSFCVGFFVFFSQSAIFPLYKISFGFRSAVCE